MSLTAELGSEVTKGDSVWRIIRITRQHCLMETEEGPAEVVEEHLLELKNELGEISFEVLSSERTPYIGPASSIKAPDPLNWRKE